MKILYAEDEAALAEAVEDVLSYHNYLVDTVGDGLEALEYARVEQYDVILLDIMPPASSGLDVLRTLRAEGCTTPILLLTAKTDVEDRILGLDLGADDYLPKPFAMGELLARIRAILRRQETYVPDVLRCGDLELDQRSSQLRCGEAYVDLPRREYLLMELFMRNPRHVFSTTFLMDKVWELETDAEIDVIWTYIGFLRKKLKQLNADIEIKTIRGAGYTLEVLQC